MAKLFEISALLSYKRGKFKIIYTFFNYLAQFFAEFPQLCKIIEREFHNFSAVLYSIFVHIYPRLNS